jgi:asparagine synthase (glutamine-hydrolysing)
LPSWRPPAHTDPVKEQAMLDLAETYLSPEAIQEAGLLDLDGVQAIFQQHQADSTPVSQRVQLDAVINHMLSVQILHDHFVKTDVPQQARKRAQELGWHLNGQV